MDCNGGIALGSSLLPLHSYGRVTIYFFMSTLLRLHRYCMYTATVVTKSFIFPFQVYDVYERRTRTRSQLESFVVCCGTLQSTNVNLSGGNEYVLTSIDDACK